MLFDTFPWTVESRFLRESMFSYTPNGLFCKYNFCAVGHACMQNMHLLMQLCVCVCVEPFRIQISSQKVYVNRWERDCMQNPNWAPWPALRMKRRSWNQCYNIRLQSILYILCFMHFFKKMSTFKLFNQLHVSQHHHCIHTYWEYFNKQCCVLVGGFSCAGGFKSGSEPQLVETIHTNGKDIPWF